MATDEFAALAGAELAALGLAALPLAIVPHPFGDRPSDEVRALATGASGGIVRALTTPADELLAEAVGRVFPEPRSIARSKPIFAVPPSRRGQRAT